MNTGRVSPREDMLKIFARQCKNTVEMEALDDL
jgi:hypothetical protein